MNRCLTWMRDNIAILIVMGIAFMMRLAIFFYYGAGYSLESDDLSYINAAIRFCKTGEITIHGVVSAQIMPGMIWLISPFVLFFGQGKLLWVALKLFWICMSLFSIWGVYKIVLLHAQKTYAVVACLFFLAIDYAWMDNIILTETPFLLGFVLLIYSSLQLADTHKTKYYWYICFWYMFTLLLKATIAPFPLFLFLYLWLKKYDLQRMLKQIGIAILIVLAFIVPWSIRNYIRFDQHFIPLTYGAGNPRLLGSYQGKNTPLDEELDYQTNVYDKMSKEMLHYIKEDGTIREEYQGDAWYENYMAAYYNLELDNMKADYRISEWKKQDMKDYIFSHLVYKPTLMLYNSFYWEDVFGITGKWNYYFRFIEILLFVIGLYGIVIGRRLWREAVFISSIYIFQIFVFSFTFAFGRYAQTLYFLRYIIIGWGLHELCRNVKKKNLKQK